jgi:Flp pilus assembly protein TadD
MDQKDRAVLEYRRLIQLWPRDPRPQGKLGSVLLAMDRLDEAEKMLRTALDLGPKTPGVHQTLGVLFWRKGDRASAITHLERETDLAPGDRSLWANLKAMYEAEGRAEDVRRIEERLAIQHEVSGTGTMIRSMDQGGGV